MTIASVIAREKLWHVHNDDALAAAKLLPSDCIHCIATSPPYFGLRDYGTGSWEGGDPECKHSVGGQVQDSKAPGAITTGVRPGCDASRCKKCGALRVDQQIGLEETPDAYAAKLVELFRELRRALHPTGSLWLNLGDSYQSGKGMSGGANKFAAGEHTIDEKLPARRFGLRPQDSRIEGLKSKDLIGIPWLVAFALRADGWYLRQWMPWVKANCLSGGAWLYARTQKGDMPVMVKDLVRLDPKTVKLWNGAKWTQVLAWWKNESPGEKIELALRSGERIGCTAEHQWPTQLGNVKASDLRVGDVIATARLPEPVSKSPAYLTQEATWFVGLYLAEGSRAGETIQISGHARETFRLDRLRAVAEHYGGSLTYTIRGNRLDIRMYGRVLVAILESYIGGKTAHDKHLKNSTWELPNELLRCVIQGYLDGDGHHDKANDRYRLGFCRNYSLERDLRTAAARLGAQVTITPKMGKGFGKTFPTFRGEWRWVKVDSPSSRDRGEIIRISGSRARQFWDIAVEDEPHLFSLASGVLTHNSMPESATDRPSTSCETIFLLTRNPDYFFDMEAVKRAAVTGSNGSSFTDPRDHSTKPNLGTGPRADDADSRNFRSADLWFDSRGMLLAGDLDGTDDNTILGFDVTLNSYKGAHFATWPQKLVAPMIKAGTSERGVCPHCFAPHARIVTKSRVPTRIGAATKVTGDSLTDGNRDPERHVTATETIGWEPSCSCPAHEPVPALVYDPFAGSGTTGKVALDLGRVFLGSELNPKYMKLITTRLRQAKPGLF